MRGGGRKIISAGGFSRHTKDVLQKYPDAFAGKSSGLPNRFRVDPLKPDEGYADCQSLGPPRQAAISAVVDHDLYIIGESSYSYPCSYTSTYRLRSEGGCVEVEKLDCELPWPFAKPGPGCHR